MWIRITDLSVKQVDANHLTNPKNPGNPMLLNLFQREGRTVFWVIKNKRVYSQYIETSTGKVISKRKWTDQMKTFAQQKLELLHPQKTVFRLTIFGWIFFLGAFALLGYLVYDGLVTSPERTEQFEQRQTEKATVTKGDIYKGRIEIYREEGSPLGMKGEFGCFKVVKIEGDTYHIAKSTEMSKTTQPLEQMNSTDFEQQTIKVQAKELSAYYKRFVSEDGLIEISFDEKKE